MLLLRDLDLARAVLEIGQRSRVPETRLRNLTHASRVYSELKYLNNNHLCTLERNKFLLKLRILGSRLREIESSFR